MLNNVQVRDRVTLSNNLNATVVNISGSTIAIRADGGKYATRLYGIDGRTYDADFNVATILPREQLSQDTAKAITSLVEKAVTPELNNPVVHHVFRDGYARLARRHVNPEGDLGGYVDLLSSVDAATRISRGSEVVTSTLKRCHLKNKVLVIGETIEDATLNGEY
jgi:hypothetical protein